jgi:hypothetical protein
MAGKVPLNIDFRVLHDGCQFEIDCFNESQQLGVAGDTILDTVISMI